MRRLYIIMTMLIFFPLALHAQSMVEQLKDTPLGKIPVGVLSGVLKKDGKPVANYPLVIQVQQAGQTVLTLPKTSDASGKFEFKNMFRAKEFSYSLFTEEGGRVYRYGPFEMNSDKLNVEFQIGPKTEMGEMPAQPKAAPADSGVVPGEWRWYQIVSLILLGGVLGALGTSVCCRRRK